MKRNHYILIGIVMVMLVAWYCLEVRAQKENEQQIVQDQVDWLKQIKPKRNSFK